MRPQMWERSYNNQSGCGFVPHPDFKKEVITCLTVKVISRLV